MNKTKPLIVFDGVCVLCSSAMQFIQTHSAPNTFRYTSLQSEKGQEVLKESNLSPTSLKTIVLVHNRNVYTKSNAALKIAYLMSGPWRLLYFLKIIPRPIRDFIYHYISKNRYKWFGKTESCSFPNIIGQ